MHSPRKYAPQLRGDEATGKRSRWSQHNQKHNDGKITAVIKNAVDAKIEAAHCWPSSAGSLLEDGMGGNSRVFRRADSPLGDVPMKAMNVTEETTTNSTRRRVQRVHWPEPRARRPLPKSMSETSDRELHVQQLEAVISSLRSELKLEKGRAQDRARAAARARTTRPPTA